MFGFFNGDDLNRLMGILLIGEEQRTYSRVDKMILFKPVAVV